MRFFYGGNYSFERTQKRDKNKALNAVLYNMLLHHDVVRVQVPFSLPPLLRAVLLYELYYSSTLTVNRVPAVVIQPSEVPDGGGAFRLGVVRSVDGFDENFDLVPGFEF